MGLSDDTWPRAPRPNPFLPIELQRAAGVSQGSSAGMLALARRLTNEWRSCAGEVVLSHPLREDDRELKPSPLISPVPERSLALPQTASYRDVVHRLRAIEREADTQAPPLTVTSVRGGASVLRDQSACPFRALALHRLGAQGLEAPHAGLDARERGTLVHRTLAGIWAKVKTRDALDAMSQPELGALIAQATEDAVSRIRRDRPTVLAGRFAEIEKRRLAQRALEWLAVEKRRGAFTVLATEDERRIETGGLALETRLDRVDQTDDGRRIVIDYKTGKSSPGDMLGDRPDEPQLPLYVTGAEPDAAAAAFAQVRAGDMKFAGLARDADLLPGVRTLPDGKLRQGEASWMQQIEAWRGTLSRIAAGFAAGNAEVDPKRYPHTCRLCDVKPFCRIYERLENALDEEAP
jgi:probable DNA repair protein